MIVTKVDKLKSKNQLKTGMDAIQKQMVGQQAHSVLGHRWPGSEGNLANHLEDQEQAVTPAAVTEDAPNEKPQEVSGDGKPAAEASSASDEKNGGTEAKDPAKTEKPASRPKTAEAKGNGKAAADGKTGG